MNKKVELTPEEQMMIEGIQLGLLPFPTPNNFEVLRALIGKGALQVAQRTPITQHNDDLIVRIPRAELPVLLAALEEGSDVCGGRGCDDLEFAQIVPDLNTRQKMMAQYHQWNGDPEVWTSDLETGGAFAEVHYWSYGSALFYLRRRIETAAE